MLTDDLADAFHEASADPPFPIDVTQATSAARRISRRRHVGLSTLTIVALLGAGIGIYPLTTTHQDTATVLPRPAPIPALAVVDGVDVTWLPPTFGSAGTPHLDALSLVQDYGLTQRFSTRTPAGATGPEGSRPYFTVGVMRNHRLNLTELQARFRGTGIPVTIHGQSGIFIDFGDPRVPPKAPQKYMPVLSLVWQETVAGQPVTLQVNGTAGTTLDQVKRVADGLVVHAAPAGPADSQASTTQIRESFTQAFTGGNRPSESLAAIDGGEQLQAAQTKLGQYLPQTALSSRVQVRKISFYDADHARVDITLTYNYLGKPANQDVRASAVRVSGTWRVTQDSYCDAISITNIPCP